MESHGSRFVFSFMHATKGLGAGHVALHLSAITALYAVGDQLPKMTRRKRLMAMAK